MNDINIAALDIKYRSFYLKDELETLSTLQMAYVSTSFCARVGNPFSRSTKLSPQILLNAVYCEQTKKIVDTLIERAVDGNCVPTYEAIIIGRNLIDGRAMIVEFLLNVFSIMTAFLICTT